MYEKLRKCYLNKLFSYFTMPIDTFDELLNIVKIYLEKKPNIKWDTIIIIVPIERLTILFSNKH